MRRKSVFRWDSGGGGGGGIHLRQKKREGLDRVELRTWMENAPRNIPGIVWEQFSGSPRTTSAPSTVYKYRGGWSSADCNCTTDSVLSSKGASITRDYPQTDGEGTVRTHPLTAGIKLGFLLKNTGDLSKMLMVTIAVLFLGSLNVVSVSLSFSPQQRPDLEVILCLPRGRQCLF